MTYPRTVGIVVIQSGQCPRQRNICLKVACKAISYKIFVTFTPFSSASLVPRSPLSYRRILLKLIKCAVMGCTILDEYMRCPETFRSLAYVVRRYECFPWPGTRMRRAEFVSRFEAMSRQDHTEVRQIKRRCIEDVWDRWKGQSTTGSSHEVHV